MFSVSDFISANIISKTLNNSENELTSGVKIWIIFLYMEIFSNTFLFLRSKP